MDELSKQYDPASAELRWSKFWDERGFFRSQPNPKKKPYTIVIPPPNVTGALHLGHALNNTLQDVIIRMKRMQGFETLWVPGVDHAGIATQATVEKRLFEREKKTRHEIGREGLVARIWEWKEQYQSRILEQLWSMGCSCDWDRTRFTLDDMCARAVQHFFFQLFADGLIYRGKRLVNWDTHLQTAVSDDEVFHAPVEGNFWYIRYPVIDPKPGEPESVMVATTRPETMLGDTAVAIHPNPAAAFDRAEAELREKLNGSEKEDDETVIALNGLLARRSEVLPTLIRLAEMAGDGRKISLPLMNREIPLVCDEWAKPELGTGCVKITPAHDPNDYEVGVRQSLPMVNLLNRDGTYNANAGAYAGLPIRTVRERVVADLDALGLLERVEERTIELSMSDRSKTPIEPYLNDQWFVRMERLAQTAMDAVESGDVVIHPPRYAKGYLDWLGEKRDWPIGRQLWWGHQIPIWYCDGGASRDTLDRAFAGRADIAYHFDDEKNQWWICSQRENLADDAVPGYTLVREEDVLDTWFSSALWPHSVLGWPEKTAELDYYYPTSLLVTSRDIITLWVARMVLASYFNTGQKPFGDVFIHPKILDKYGEGMSKTKGNGVDPIFVMEKFGADSLRFAIAYLTTESQDVRLGLDFECPHCGVVVEQTKKNRVLPKIGCPKCKKEFSTQWAETPEDKALPPGAVVGERFEAARNFCNKLWNAARFVMLNLDGFVPRAVSFDELRLEDRWILSRTLSVVESVSAALESFRFAEAARTLHDFAWDEFCSFYVEMVKARLFDTEQKPIAQNVLVAILDLLLRLLHPITPFVTEEIWQRLVEFAPTRGLVPHPASEAVTMAPWPQTAEIPFVELSDADYARTIAEQFATFQEVLRMVREIRSRQNIPPKTEIRVTVRCAQETVALLEPMKPSFAAMAGAKIEAWGGDVSAPALAASLVGARGEVFVDLADLIDVDAEISRKEKEIEKLTGLVAAKEGKLSGGFAEKAPVTVVEKERAQLADMKNQLATNQTMLANLLAAKK